MKVNFVTPRGLPQTGGVEYHIHYLAEALVDKGCEVAVYSQSTLQDLENTREHTHRYATRQYPLRLNSYYAFNLKLIKDALRLIREGEIVHLQAAHKPLSTLIALLAGKRFNNLFFTPHYHGEGHTGLANFAHTFYRWFLSAALNNVGTIIAVSDSVAEIIRAHFPKVSNRITVIPNGTANPNTYSSDSSKAFLVVSRLEKYKNIDRIIDNLPAGERLIIVGDGPDKERLESLAVSKNVSFLGRLSDTELDAVWSESKTLVSLSEKEAYGMVAAEALARGLNVVLSDIPAHRFVYRLSGFDTKIRFVSSGESVSDILSKCAADKEKRSPNLFYSWERVGEETLNTYNRNGVKL